jgi:hypothetical protein
MLRKSSELSLWAVDSEYGRGRSLSGLMLNDLKYWTIVCERRYCFLFCNKSIASYITFPCGHLRWIGTLFALRFIVPFLCVNERNPWFSPQLLRRVISKCGGHCNSVWHSQWSLPLVHLFQTVGLLRVSGLTVRRVAWPRLIATSMCRAVRATTDPTGPMTGGLLHCSTASALDSETGWKEVLEL